MRDEGQTLTAIAQHFQVAISTVSYWVLYGTKFDARRGDWTAERVARLMELWESGMKTPEIGGDLKINKNQVIGKVHRLVAAGLLKSRDNPAPNRTYTRTEPAPKVSKPSIPRRTTERKEEPKPRIIEIGPEHLSRAAPKPIHALRIIPSYTPSHIWSAPATPRPVPAPVVPVYRRESECCWPIGEPGTRGFRFCGETHRNRSYCDSHQSLAYVRVRRKDAAD